MLGEKSNRNRNYIKGLFFSKLLLTHDSFSYFFLNIVIGEIVLNLVLFAVLATLSNLLLLDKF